MNPYNSQYAVEQPAHLYGRRGILTHLLDALLQETKPQSREIVGPTRIGKTSLLKVLTALNSIQKLPEIAAFDLPLEHRERLLSSQCRGRLLFVRVTFAGVPGDNPAAVWRLMSRQLLNAATSLQAENTEAEYSRMYNRERTEVAHLETDLHWVLTKAGRYSPPDFVVFLLDEFDRVAQRLPLEMAGQLRHFLEEQPVAYITAMRHTLEEYYGPREEQHAEERVSPLYTIFDPRPIFLGLLEDNPDARDVTQFIRAPAAQHGVLFTEDDVRFARCIGGRHPDITRLVCRRLFEIRQTQGQTTLDYQELEHHVRQDVQPLLSSLWRHLGELEQEALQSLVGQRGRALDRQLVRLEQLGLVVHGAGDNYRVFSPVLRSFIEQMDRAKAGTRGPAGRGESQAEPIEAEARTGALTVWPEQRAVQIGNKLQVLRPKEWKVFSMLRERAGQICSRAELLAGLSANDPTVSDTALDATLSRLRQKIEPEPDKPRIIVTVRGHGYRFEA